MVRCISCHSSGHRCLICWDNPRRYSSCLAHRETTASTSAPHPLRSRQTFLPSLRQCRRCIYIWVKCLQTRFTYTYIRKNAGVFKCRYMQLLCNQKSESWGSFYRNTTVSWQHNTFIVQFWKCNFKPNRLGTYVLLLLNITFKATHETQRLTKIV